MDEVVVPDVVGLTVQDAVQVGLAAGVLLVAHDKDGPALHVQSWRARQNDIVRAQDPAAGTPLARNAPVTVWFHRGPVG